MRLFAEITKIDEEQRLVCGYASTEAMDSQNEIVSKNAIRGALPDYLKFGNIREMHRNSAVGVTKGADMDEKGLYLEAHIVDDAAWKKVKAKVYKGFSIGGRVIERDPANKAIITALDLTEISLVDRPANPDAMIDLFKAEGGDTTDVEKRDYDTAERKQMAENGEAMSDGSFPIKTKQDLENAIRLAGHANDPAKAKAHIKARAKALDAENLIPDTWKTEMDQDVSKNEPATPEKDDLEKVGRRNSAADLDKLQAIHDHACALGAACAGGDDADKADEPTDLAKMQSEIGDLQASLKKMADERDALAERVAELEKIPAAVKGAVTGTPVTKTEDGGAAAEPEPANAIEAIKKAHRNPHLIKL